MSASSSPHPDVSHPPIRRLKLVVNTPLTQNQESGSSIVKEESSSPTRPSYSPVTPTLSQPNLATHDASENWIDEPEPLPVSLDENPDAIALRAAISILQMQRQQTLRDIRNLDRMKQEAMKDPKAFVDDLKAGNLQKSAQIESSFDSGDEDDTDRESKAIESTSKFGTLPTPQNVIRAPPIEWSKYHIAGDALNTMHQVQQRYPGVTEEALARGVQPQPHEIAAPYRPFADKIEQKPASESRTYND